MVDLVVEELQGVKQTPVPDAELQRAKDHLKGSLMLSLENTASRMSHLARQEIYFDRQVGLDETLAGRRAGDGRGRAARGDGLVPERLALGDGAGQRERIADSARATRFRIGRDSPRLTDTKAADVALGVLGAIGLDVS